MAEQTWYFASDGKQLGPYSDDQLREFIARGTVTSDTLVWRAGMAGWQKAAEVPDLAAALPPLPTGAAGPGGALVPEFGTFGLFGRVLLAFIGVLLVVPAPWVATMVYRWGIAHIRVPGRPNLGFTGKPGDIWYVFVLIGLCSYGGLADIWWLPLALIPVNGFLAWMALRWVVANISSDGQRLPFTFKGSPWAYIGWMVFLYVSMISIIGWAWVTSAWMRWICRNVEGPRRAIVFNGSGWGVLWRTLAFVFGSILIIPIPWLLKWFASWYVSQIALVDRASLNA